MQRRKPPKRNRLVCERCRKPAVPGNPLYPGEVTFQYIHLYCK